MKKYIIVIIITVAIIIIDSIVYQTVTFQLKNQVEAADKLIETYENLLDEIYHDNTNHFLDITMETDVYYEYTEALEEYESIKELSLW